MFWAGWIPHIGFYIDWLNLCRQQHLPLLCSLPGRPSPGCSPARTAERCLCGSCFPAGTLPPEVPPPEPAAAVNDFVLPLPPAMPQLAANTKRSTHIYVNKHTAHREAEGTKIGLILMTRTTYKTMDVCKLYRQVFWVKCVLFWEASVKTVWKKSWRARFQSLTQHETEQTWVESRIAGEMLQWRGWGDCFAMLSTIPPKPGRQAGSRKSLCAWGSFIHTPGTPCRFVCSSQLQWTLISVCFTLKTALSGLTAHICSMFVYLLAVLLVDLIMQSQACM